MSMKKRFGHIVAESVKIVHDFILLQWVNNWFELYQSAIENAIISFFELLTKKNPYISNFVLSCFSISSTIKFPTGWFLKSGEKCFKI